MDIEIKREPIWIHHGVLAFASSPQAIYFQYFARKFFALNILRTVPLRDQ
jgi:hypothetical protein